jgi:predicted PurR-regulated permease PerM
MTPTPGESSTAAAPSDAAKPAAEPRPPSRLELIRERRASTQLVGPHIWTIRWVRDLTFVAAVVGIFLFGYALRAIFTPILIALFLAYLFDPIINWVDRKHKISRLQTVSLFLSGSLLLLLVVSLFAVPAVIDQATNLVRSIAGFIREPPAEVEQWLADRGIVLDDWSERLDAAVADLKQDPMRALQVVFAGSQPTFSFVGSFIGAATYVVVTIVLIPVYFFFFAWQFPAIYDLKAYIPTSQRDDTFRIMQRMDYAVASFFRGRVVIAVIMGLMFWIGFWIVGVPNPLVLGLVTGFLSIIPYLSAVGWIIAMGLCAIRSLSGDSADGFDFMYVFIWPTVVYAIVQVLEGWVLTPWIQSQSTDLNAVTIIIVVFIGGAVGGLYGLLLCVPIAACIKIILDEWALPRLKQWAQTH